jgi:Flp pilus assembly protein TadG
VAALEFAVVAPVLFVFILGIIEIGRGLMVKHLLNNAARQGCRAGLIEGKSDTDITNSINTLLASQGISGQATTVQVNNQVTNSSGAVAGDQITVTITVSTSQISWVPVPQYLSGNITGTYTLRRE